MKYILLALAVSLFYHSANAEQITHPYFYKLEYQGKKSYILGTLHAGVSADQLPPQILKIIVQSRLALGEMENNSENMRLMSDARRNTTAVFLEQALKEHPNYKTSLTTSQLKTFVDFGIPEELAIYLDKAECNYTFFAPGYSFPKAISLDLELLDFIHKTKIPYTGLDTDLTNTIFDIIEKQLDFYPECKMIDMIDKLEDLKKWMQDLVNDYVTFSYQTEETLDFSVGMRNIFWLRKLIPEIQKGDAFIFVGLSHLLDNKDAALLNIFEKQGIKVRRIEFREIDSSN